MHTLHDGTDFMSASFKDFISDSIYVIKLNGNRENKPEEHVYIEGLVYNTI
jgi:hypothetical protein